MANASLDENSVPTITAGLNTDGRTIVRVKIDSTTHALKVSDGTSGTDHGPVNDLRDENNRTTLMAVSSVDGVTPVVLYADSSGNLLIQTT